ncbi:hypothetical protein [Streptomyces sp. NPDC094466]|uniref:hypothetical protein n=1 Tax=Streptomyces sp. NPDC094466 TaxID=3366065 RepID=UPI00380C0997
MTNSRADRHSAAHLARLRPTGPAHVAVRHTQHAQHTQYDRPGATDGTGTPTTHPPHTHHASQPAPQHQETPPW